MEWVKLGDIISIKKGKKLLEVDEPTENSIRYIQIEDLRDDNNLKYTEDDKAVLANSDDILIAWDGANAGTIGFRISGAIGSTIAKLSIKKSFREKFTYEFLGYFLKSKNNYLIATSTGATIPHISRNALTKIKVPIIALEEQEKLIDIFENLETLIQTLQDQIQALDDLVESILYNFIKDKSNKFEILGNIFEIKSGATPSRKNEQYWNSNDIPWVKSNQLTGEIINSAEEYISKEGYKNSSTYMFPKNTVLIAMYGQGKTRGQVGLLNIETTTNQAIAGLIPTDCVNMKFVFYQLKNMYENLRSYSQGGNQKNLSVTLLKQIKIILPSIEKQNQFAAFVEKIEKQKQILNDSLEELTDLFDSLMQDAFDGSITM